MKKLAALSLISGMGENNSKGKWGRVLAHEQNLKKMNPIQSKETEF